MTGRRINGIPLPDRHKGLGAKEIPPRHQRPHMQGGGGSSGGGGGGKKHGSGFFVFPLPIELGLLFLVLFLGTWGPT